MMALSTPLKTLLLLSGCLSMIVALPVQAQTTPLCGPDVKQEIVKRLGAQDAQGESALALQKELYDVYKYCAEDEQLPAEEYNKLSLEYCGKVTYLGSTFYERMRCCGYDPQKQLFGCPVEVKQPFGFGPAPMPGSFEYVLSCVDVGGGYQPVALDHVHLADAVSGNPEWSFAVIARARGRLAEAPLNGKTFRARSILSWAFVPTDCHYQPIWGNAIDYQIRLDP